MGASDIQALAKKSHAARLVLDFDWSRSPVGSMSAWPPELTVAVQLAFQNKAPTLVAWGSELTQIYNDAFIAVLRERHPAALGQSVRACWADAWHVTGPIFQSVMRTGLATCITDMPITLQTLDVTETRFFDVNYAAIALENGTIGGVLSTCIEITDRHLLQQLDQSQGSSELPNRFLTPACVVVQPDP